MEPPWKLFVDVHHGILIATEHYRWWFRPLAYAGWWISLIPKLPLMISYAFDDEDGNQNYPGS